MHLLGTGVALCALSLQSAPLRPALWRPHFSAAERAVRRGQLPEALDELDLATTVSAEDDPDGELRLERYKRLMKIGRRTCGVGGARDILTHMIASARLRPDAAAAHIMLSAAAYDGEPRTGPQLGSPGQPHVWRLGGRAAAQGGRPPAAEPAAGWRR